MRVLVLGGTGATGRLLVRQLLEADHEVVAIVRARERVPTDLRDHPALQFAIGSALTMSEGELIQLVRGCDAVACCLGHTLSIRGILGPPWRLVTSSIRRVCRAILSDPPAKPIRLVLMSSAGVRDRRAGERVGLGQRVVIALVRLLVPPHADNEQATAYLQRQVPVDGPIAWVIVRPDTLIDEDAITPYDHHRSPRRSAIFDPGRTSRINVAHCMAELATDDDRWREWAGSMPVIYNREPPER